MTRAQTQRTLRQLPTKWAIALLGLIVLYAVAQPALNSRFGWSLPSLARLMGEPETKKPATDDNAKEIKAKKSAPLPDNQPTPRDDEGNQQKSGSKAAIDAPLAPQTNEVNKSGGAKTEPAATKPLAKSPNTTASAARKPDQSKPDQSKPAESKVGSSQGDSKFLYGILKETGRDRYVSVAGLQYNPGSEEGHRLKHLERHLKDIPDRPGKHGVFDGEMKDALKWIDDAYARGQKGAAGVRKTQEDNRTVYEAPFAQPIGYVGGRDGKRAGNPKAKRLRLVVEGSKFITAFPF